MTAQPMQAARRRGQVVGWMQCWGVGRQLVTRRQRLPPRGRRAPDFEEVRRTWPDFTLSVRAPGGGPLVSRLAGHRHRHRLGHRQSRRRRTPEAAPPGRRPCAWPRPPRRRGGGPVPRSSAQSTPRRNRLRGPGPTTRAPRIADPVSLHPSTDSKLILLHGRLKSWRSRLALGSGRQGHEGFRGDCADPVEALMTAGLAVGADCLGHFYGGGRLDF